MADAIEGYDYQFAKPGPTDDQKCPICFLVVRDAHQVNCCGKLMCNWCLNRCKNGSSTCPMCRENIGDKYFKDTKSDREIKSLSVYCKYTDEGCDWIGEMRNIESHTQECDYCMVNCPDCKEKMSKQKLIGHCSICPAVLVKCEIAGCNKIVERCQLVSHVKVCPKQLITCPFDHMGCKFESKREDVTSHIVKDVSLHVGIIAQRIRDNDLIAPLVVKITGLERGKEKNETLVSDGFYTGVGGYKVFLKLFPNGIYSGRSTHMSVFANLMPGANDDKIEFPFRGAFIVTLLNQLENKNHHTMTIKDNGINTSCDRKYKADMAGFGHNRFILISSLDNNKDRNTKYIHDDAVYLRIETKITSKTKPWLVAP